jgi:hypothetical protein
MHNSNFFVREYFNREANYAEVIVSSKCHTVPEPGESWSVNSCVDDDENIERIETDEEREERRKKYIDDSIRRSRKQVKFLTINNVTSGWRMLTLTYAGDGCYCRDTVARDVQHMVEKIEQEEKADIQYICAFELHPKGHGYHAHLLIDCRYYRNETFQEKFWSHGFVKLKKMWFKGRVADALNAARYITKYITKDVTDAVKNKKRYSASRNLFREPFRYDLKFCNGEDIKKFVSKIKERGYKFVENYDYQIGEEKFQVAFYKRVHKDIKSKEPVRRCVAAIAQMFGADECFI